MFTKNWYKAIFISQDLIPRKYTNHVGEEYDMSWSHIGQIGISSDSSFIPSIYKMRTSLDGGGGVIIGIGTAEPTIDDISLSGDMITTFSYTASVTKELNGDESIIQAVYTITNTGSEEFTIGEIGLTAGPYGNTSWQFKALYERTVLESPVTIPAGGIGQVTYTIRMKYPWATS